MQKWIKHALVSCELKSPTCMFLHVFVLYTKQKAHKVFMCICSLAVHTVGTVVLAAVNREELEVANIGQSATNP